MTGFLGRASPGRGAEATGESDSVGAAMYARAKRWRRVAASLGAAALLLALVGPIVLPPLWSLLTAAALAGVMTFVVMTKLSLGYEREALALEGDEIQSRIAAAVRVVNATARVARRKPNGCVIRSNNSPPYRLVFRWEKTPRGGYNVSGRSEPPGLGEFSDRLLRARIVEWVKIRHELDTKLDSDSSE